VQDRQRFDELRRSCYQAADNNRNGEYPALQAMACDRYAQFAAAHGRDAGILPGYGLATPPQPAQPETAAVEPAPGVPQEYPYVIGPGYDAGHQPRPRPPQEPGRPQGQIGPNYTPPPMQQPPPVSQRRPAPQD
jgi:hypothetical protein